MFSDVLLLFDALHSNLNIFTYKQHILLEIPHLFYLDRITKMQISTITIPEEQFMGDFRSRKCRNKVDKEEAIQGRRNNLKTKMYTLNQDVKKCY